MYPELFSFNILVGAQRITDQPFRGHVRGGDKSRADCCEVYTRTYIPLMNQNLGLLLSGIGGGCPELLDVNAGFFNGGGGGAFFPRPPAGCKASAELDPPAKLLTLPAMPYF
jgi:hypothetical protein